MGAAKKETKETVVENTTELLIWDIDPEIKRNFKATCINKDVSMRDTIIDFMKSYK